jgi:ATP-binding cassette subfamily F protein uup
MNYLSVEGLSKAYGDRTLFKDVTFGISQGQKVALIAANGTGKTTLLKIIKGMDIPDSGRVVFRNDITVGFLDQNPIMDPEATVIDTLFSAKNPMMEAVREYERCVENPDGIEVSEQEMHDAIEKMEALKAWDYEARTKQILGQLGIHQFSQLTKSLSGGQRKRVALAKLLIEDPEFIILDEPTNHLDVEMIEWLEGYLVGLNKTLLLVTHDRYFLDRITTEIVEIDNGKLYSYKGNYSYFLEKKDEREQMANSEIDKARNLYKRELDWMRRQPKARSTKQKARIDSFYVTEEKATQSKTEQKLNLGVNMSRLGNKILELDNVSKAYDDKVMLKKFSYVFRRKERIGIVGKNGVGKSTFLNLLMGLTKPDMGIIETGETIVFGYYSQEGLVLKEDKRVIEVVKDIAEFIPVGNGEMLSASQFLLHFQFSPEKQYTFASKLSGGEMRRLHLLTILMKNPNFLVLDEPTNDLDLITLGILEEFLMNFGGCLIVVTHDRYFMDKLVEHLFIFEGDGVIKDYNGTYSAHRDELDEKERNLKKGQKPDNTVKVVEVAPELKSTSKKISYKEQKEYNDLESEIAELETKKDELSHRLNSGITDHIELSKLAASIESTIKTIETKTERWLELAEML